MCAWSLILLSFVFSVMSLRPACSQRFTSRKVWLAAPASAIIYGPITECPASKRRRPERARDTQPDDTTARFGRFIVPPNSCPSNNDFNGTIERDDGVRRRFPYTEPDSPHITFTCTAFTEATVRHPSQQCPHVIIKRPKIQPPKMQSYRRSGCKCLHDDHSTEHKSKQPAVGYPKVVTMPP